MAYVKYYQSYGGCGGSDEVGMYIDLTPEEEIIYDREIEKIKSEIAKNNPNLDPKDIELTDDDMNPLNEIPELRAALSRAAYEAAEYEISEYGNQEFMEKLGLNEMDTYELEELVQSKDPYALKYFGLENATDEELGDWSAYSLPEVPTVKDFKKDFVPEEPDISVRFAAD